VGALDPLAGLAWAAAGAALGAGAGLVPGLHPNTLATGALLVGLDGGAPARAASLLLGGVLGAWTFANAIPLVVLGVPDGEDAPALLPGQRMAREGHARAALRASARGSLVGLAFGCAAAVAIVLAVERADPDGLVQAATPAVQALALAVLVGTDPVGPARASLVAGLAGALGVVALDLPVASPLGLPSTPLAPLFIGLFGLPALVHAARAGAPPAEIGTLVDRSPRPPGPAPGLLGSGLGLVAGTFAGFTSGPATAIAAVAWSGSDRDLMATTAAVNTSAVCVATGMLHALGRTRTGVHAAQRALAAPPPGTAGLPLALAAMAIAARRWRPIARLVPRLAPALVVGWAGLVLVQSGLVGLAIAGAGWACARAAAALGTRRSVLMACLLVPGLAQALP